MSQDYPKRRKIPRANFPTEPPLTERGTLEGGETDVSCFPHFLIAKRELGIDGLHSAFPLQQESHATPEPLTASQHSAESKALVSIHLMLAKSLSGDV